MSEKVSKVISKLEDIFPESKPREHEEKVKVNLDEVTMNDLDELYMSCEVQEAVVKRSGAGVVLIVTP